MSDLLRHLMQDSAKEFFTWWQAEYDKSPEQFNFDQMKSALQSPTTVNLHGLLSKKRYRYGQPTKSLEKTLDGKTKMTLPQLPSREILLDLARCIANGGFDYWVIPDNGNGVITAMLCHVLKKNFNKTLPMFAFKGEFNLSDDYSITQLIANTGDKLIKEIGRHSGIKNAKKQQAFIFFPWSAVDNAPHQIEWLGVEMLKKSMICAIHDAFHLTAIARIGNVAADPRYKQLAIRKVSLCMPSICPDDDLSENNPWPKLYHAVITFHQGADPEGFQERVKQLEWHKQSEAQLSLTKLTKSQNFLIASVDKQMQQIWYYMQLGILPKFDIKMLFPHLTDTQMMRLISRYLLATYQPDAFNLDHQRFDRSAALMKYNPKDELQLPSAIIDKLLERAKAPVFSSSYDDNTFLSTAVKVCLTGLDADLLINYFRRHWPELECNLDQLNQASKSDTGKKNAYDAEHNASLTDINDAHWKKAQSAEFPYFDDLKYLWEVHPTHLIKYPDIVFRYFNHRKYAIERLMLIKKLGLGQLTACIKDRLMIMHPRGMSMDISNLVLTMNSMDISLRGKAVVVDEGHTAVAQTVLMKTPKEFEDIATFVAEGQLDIELTPVQSVSGDSEQPTDEKLISEHATEECGDEGLKNQNATQATQNSVAKKDTVKALLPKKLVPESIVKDPRGEGKKNKDITGNLAFSIKIEKNELTKPTKGSKASVSENRKPNKGQSDDNLNKKIAPKVTNRELAESTAPVIAKNYSGAVTGIWNKATPDSPKKENATEDSNSTRQTSSDDSDEDSWTLVKKRK